MAPCIARMKNKFTFCKVMQVIKNMAPCIARMKNKFTFCKVMQVISPQAMNFFFPLRLKVCSNFYRFHNDVFSQEIKSLLEGTTQENY